MKQNRNKPFTTLFMGSPTANFAFLLFFLCLSSMAFGQKDSLTLEAFLQLVQTNHPVSRQAALLNDQARAEQMRARGMFDPKLYSEWQQKSFDGKTYFTTGQSGFKVPSWYGISLKGEYNMASGAFLNPEDALPASGQAVAGITLTALQGLLIDERRTAIRLANQFVSVNANEQALILNQLNYDAAYAYWDWVYAHLQKQIIDSAVEVAQRRFDGIRESYLAGDKPAIDTLEAYIQVQTRWADQLDAAQEVLAKSQMLSVFTWDTNRTPIEPDTTLVPALASVLQLNMQGINPNFAAQINSHPEVLRYALKINTLEIDQRLKREKLKPRLDLSYNFLGQGWQFGTLNDGTGSLGQNLFTQNYKWGLDFGFPLFLRKERGELKLNQLKIKESNLEMEWKQSAIRAKIQTATAQVANLNEQIRITESMTANYQALQDAEITRFAIGESSIFLINSRENKRIEAEQKLAKLRVELKKAEAGVRFAAAQWN